MDPDKYLIAAAQISLAMAGFAGVVAAFRNRSENGWGVVELFWLRLLLFNSILPFAFSLVGIFITVVDQSRASWRWSSSFAALCLVPYAVMIVKQLRAMAPGMLEAAGGGWLGSRALLGILIAICLLQVWNAAFRSQFWPFFAAILALILGGAFQFARLVLTSHRPDPREKADNFPKEL